MRDPAYAPHERLVSGLRARPQLWRLFLGLAIIVAVILGLNLALMASVGFLGSDTQVEDLANGSSPGGLLALLTSFGFVTAGVALVVGLLQNRHIADVIGPWQEAVRQFWNVFRLLLVLAAVVLVLPPYDMGAPMTANLQPGLWLALLPLSLSAVLIQTSAEEILFRGYIQQTLAARFRSPVIWIGVPSVLFAVGHYLPVDAGENAILIVIWAGLFGFLVSDITARAGTLGPAIAMHFFNNIFALLIMALPGGLDGLALFHLPYDMSDTGPLRAWLLVDFAFMLLSWLVARIALRR